MSLSHPALISRRKRTLYNESPREILREDVDDLVETLAIFGCYKRKQREQGLAGFYCGLFVDRLHEAILLIEEQLETCKLVETELDPDEKKLMQQAWRANYRSLNDELYELLVRDTVNIGCESTTGTRNGEKRRKTRVSPRRKQSFYLLNSICQAMCADGTLRSPQMYRKECFYGRYGYSRAKKRCFHASYAFI